MVYEKKRFKSKYFLPSIFDKYIVLPRNIVKNVERIFLRLNKNLSVRRKMKD